MPPISVSSGPSLALGLLKSTLVREGISCWVDYADLYFNTAVGMDDVYKINSGEMTDFLGDYIFAPLAGIETEWGEKELKTHLKGCLDPEKYLDICGTIKRIRPIARREVQKTAERILNGHPRIVGTSSCFQQRNAALAILKKIKEMDPSVVTVMGGANCFGAAGLAVLRTFAYVDYVFFGESDDIFGPVIKNILEGGENSLPYGVLGRSSDLPKEPPHRIVMDLDSLPYPDFDDFFELIYTDVGRAFWDCLKISASKEEKITLFLEGSRGCSWGAAHPCTFCGLMGLHRTYRAKSPERFFKELCYITEKYGITRVNLTDTLMPKDWPEKLFPLLEEHPVKFTLFTEMRTSFPPELMERMAGVGIVFTQPGVESLSQHTLELMHKGVTVMNNLTHLKYSRRYGISPAWNIIMGFPGEVLSDYTTQIRMLPLLEHFKPPNCTGPLVYARDNTYYNHPEEYGLKLVPKFMYHFTSPADPVYQRDIAYYFEDTALPVPTEISEAANRLRDAATSWQLRFISLDGHIRLDYAEVDDKLLVIDTRRCRAVRAQYVIGAEKEVLLACKKPVNTKALLHFLCDSGRCSREDLSIALTSLMAKKLMLRYGDSYLTLAIEYTREELVQREIEDFLYFKEKNKDLREEFWKFMEENVGLRNYNEKKIAEGINAFARKQGMYFTGTDLIKYYEK